MAKASLLDGLTRTRRSIRPKSRVCRASATVRRASSLRLRATPSSKSIMTVSTPIWVALLILRRLSPGIKSAERRGKLSCWGLVIASSLLRTFKHQGSSFKLDHNDIFLVAAKVPEADDAPIRFGLGFTFAKDFSFDVQSISVEHGMGVLDGFVAQVRHQGSFRQFRDGQAHGQAEGKDTVDNAAAKLGFAGELLVQVERLGIHG